MKIKTFRIRTDDAHLSRDEKSINQFMEAVTVKKSATQFVNDKENYWSVLVYYEDGLPKDHDSIMGAKSDKLSYPADTVLNNEESIVFNTLKDWRNDLATKTRMPGYIICHNSELVTIAKIKPKSLEELGKIKGFSSRKILKYGDDVLALLNSV